MTLKSVANMLVHDIFEGIYQNFDLFPAEYGDFYDEQCWMGGNNWNFDYFPIKFSDFDQINIGRITFWSILSKFQ